MADEICQGDVFRDLTVLDPFDSRIEVGKRTCPVVLLTNDCDIDKPKNKVFQVVRVVPFSEVSGSGSSIIGEARDDTSPRLWMLPAVPEIGDCFVDFREIFRVDRIQIEDAAKDGRRLASMTEDARKVLFARLYTYFRRKQRPRGADRRAPKVEVIDPEAEVKGPGA